MLLLSIVRTKWIGSVRDLFSWKDKFSHA
jgi:hypothetical protein